MTNNEQQELNRCIGYLQGIALGMEAKGYDNCRTVEGIRKVIARLEVLLSPAPPVPLVEVREQYGTTYEAE